MSTKTIQPLNSPPPISPPPISPILNEESFRNGGKNPTKKHYSKDHWKEGLSESLIFAFTSRRKDDHYNFPRVKDLIKVASIVSGIGIHFFSFGAAYTWYICLKNKNFIRKPFINPEWIGSVIYSKSALITVIALQILSISLITNSFFKKIKQQSDRREGV